MQEWPEAIIWDLDGTLVDSVPGIAQALNSLLRENGHAALEEDVVRSMIGNGVARLVERGFTTAGQRPDEETLSALVQRFMLFYSKCLTERVQLYPGVREILGYCATAGIRQGICTNKPAAPTDVILEHFTIRSHFDVVVGGDTANAKKPDPLPLQFCLDALNVAASDCLMIGDSAVDVATARAIGMPVAVVCHGYANAPVTSLGADFIISDLSQLFFHIDGGSDQLSANGP